MLAQFSTIQTRPMPSGHLDSCLTLAGLLLDSSHSRSRHAMRGASLGSQTMAEPIFSFSKIGVYLLARLRKDGILQSCSTLSMVASISYVLYLRA